MSRPRQSGQVHPERDRPLALAYVRVSTTKQADEGASLPAQPAILTTECERRGWDLEIVADEGMSGKSLRRRPNLIAALERLDRGEADALIATRLDRISRSAVDFLGILNRARARSWNVVLLDLDLDLDLATPHGKAMAGVIAVFAELERELIAERTREGMAQRMAEGVVMGRPQELCPELRARIAATAAAGTAYAAIAS
jgi:DNA invertase Pin-like site-specific DNA recombinase